MPDQQKLLKSIFSSEITFLQRYPNVAGNVLVLLIGLLTYGYTFLSFTYNNDGIWRVLSADISFSNGLAIGRWMYAFFANIYFTSVRLPLFHGLLSLFLLFLCVRLVWYIFKIESLSVRVLVGGMFMSFPIFIHYFYYSGDAEVYATGMVLTFLSLHCFTWQSRTGYLFSVVLIAIALGCYPALFSFITTVYAFFVFQRYADNYEISKNILLAIRALLVLLIGLLFYYLITKALLSLNGIELTTYKNADHISIQGLLIRFPYKVIWVVLLFIKYVLSAGILYILAVAAAFTGLLWMIIRETWYSAKHILYGILLMLGICISTHSTYLITYERWSYPGFQFGLIIFSGLLFAYVHRVPTRIWRAVIYFTGIVCIISQIKTDNEISLKYALRLDAGQRLVSQLMHDIAGSAGFHKDTTQIAFVGNLAFNSNYQLTDPLPGVRALNGLRDAPVMFNAYDVSTLITNQMLLQGVKMVPLRKYESDKYENHVRDQAIPDYPENGSIVMIDKVLIVNLGLSFQTGSPEEEIPQGDRIRVNSTFIRYIAKRI